jgi:hypothetical protein
VSLLLAVHLAAIAHYLRIGPLTTVRRCSPLFGHLARSFGTKCYRPAQAPLLAAAWLPFPCRPAAQHMCPAARRRCGWLPPALSSCARRAPPLAPSLCSSRCSWELTS